MCQSINNRLENRLVLPPVNFCGEKSRILPVQSFPLTLLKCITHPSASKLILKTHGIHRTFLVQYNAERTVLEVPQIDSCRIYGRRRDKNEKCDVECKERSSLNTTSQGSIPRKKKGNQGIKVPVPVECDGMKGTE